jgi:single-stranded-DNA-specific exonuclease
MKINEIFKDNEEITIDSYLKKCGVKNVKEFIKPHIPFEKPEIDNWFDYYNMDKARNMFIKHYNFKTPTYIICDSDLDGITSTAFIYMYMKALKEDWNIEILIHNGKERGLQDENIFQQIKSNPRGFIIIPDSGTNDRDKANELKGLDILVLDHHDIETPIENGILINNQSDKNKNISKNGSGCLVTYMFCKSLDNYFNNDWCHWNMDLVALSLISHSMNMADQQNRNFYHLGLETIDCVLNTFLESTFLRFIGNKPYTQRDISFKIVPKFNSVIRTENQELKRKVIECFTYECEDIGDILDLCENCHKNQIALVDNIINNNKDNIENANKNNIVVLSCDDMPRSYSGLVAGKIMNLCGGKPTIVGKIKDNQLLGSLRSPIPLRSDLDSNELVEWAIGHENSCGVSINKDNIDSLVEYYNNIKISYEPHIDVLKSYSINNIPNSIYELFGANLDVLWGYGIPKPLFEIHDIIYYPNDIQILGSNKRTVKIINNGLNLLLFNVTKQQKADLGLGYIVDNEFYENIKTEKMCLSCVGTLSVNEYKGYKNNQMIIEDFKVIKYKPKTVNNVFRKR